MAKIQYAEGVVMNSRERVMAALNFQAVDRVPKDLACMRSTGVAAFTYQSLRHTLGLPYKPTLVYDQSQMLALPHVDVLDALGCDIVTVESDGITDAYEQPERWQPYDFNGRIPHAMVPVGSQYTTDAEGAIHLWDMKMPPGAHVFESEHAGQILVLEGELPRPNLQEVRTWLESSLPTDAQIRLIRDTCRRVRESSDRAVLYSGLNLGICIHNYGGVAVFPVLCLEDPDFVQELHALHLEYALQRLHAVLPEIKDEVDIVHMDADDWGNQNSLMASPDIYRRLFLPYRKQYNAEIHAIAPHAKTFLHSCGAIYTLLDLLIESGIDVLNPVQWPAGKHTPREWKDKVRRRMSFCGGGVDSQHTLPLGSLEEIEREIAQTVPILAEDGGYIFANIHNLLAEVVPEKIVAIYRAAAAAKLTPSNN
jgi:uroporphyrinogen decarboxylase